jgi:Xaa-Pro aminopeptidase
MIGTRIESLRKAIRNAGIDAMLVLIEENRRYLSGFLGEDHQFDESAGALIISQDQLILATDSRFEVQARMESPLYEVVVYRKGLAKLLPDLIQRLDIRKLGFESIRLSVKQYEGLCKELELASLNVELIPLEDMVEELRLIKSPEEIQRTRKALSLAESVFKSVVRSIAPGMTEKEVAWSMEVGMREAGADSLSFPVIVAAGKNSALPHAQPSDRPIESGEPILFDWGARLDGYCSDTSRTVILGKPDQTFLAVHQTVLSAQLSAIAAIKAGASSKRVDAVARDFISQNGYEGKFGHGLGHGTGLAVHEGPRLSPLKETTLRAGMIVTVEPGIYLPDWGGVRIEHQVVVGEDGPIVLNALSTAYAINEI